MIQEKSSTQWNYNAHSTAFHNKHNSFLPTLFLHQPWMLLMRRTLAHTALTLDRNRAFWILFAILTWLSHSPVLIDNTKQINQDFLHRFPQTHSFALYQYCGKQLLAVPSMTHNPFDRAAGSPFRESRGLGSVIRASSTDPQRSPLKWKSSMPKSISG